MTQQWRFLSLRGFKCINSLVLVHTSARKTVMTEDPRERKPLARRQDRGNIHRRLNPSVETVDQGESWDGQRKVHPAQILGGAWVA